jgi:uncharacterized membrane protein YphA (DoxX/SURF4 family)
MLVSPVAGTLLAFTRLSRFAAIPAALGTAVTAFSKFSAPDEKMQRYSETIAGIKRYTFTYGDICKKVKIVTKISRLRSKPL